jgi:hypothetical protein
MPSSDAPDKKVATGSPVGTGGSASQPTYMMLGPGLATWVAFYTYDGVNLVLPDTRECGSPFGNAMKVSLVSTESIWAARNSTCPSMT